MANIRVDVDFIINDGCDVVFKAPCAASEVTGLVVYYPNLDGTTGSQTFTFKDAHGNDLSNIDNLFASGAIVKVVLDTVNSGVYIQNADTNAYLEGKFNTKANKHTISSATMSASGWNSGVYSFESSYPVLTYDIEIEIDGDNCTTEQLEAWSKAQIVGSFATNSCKALGDVPTIDIPIIIKAVVK